MALLKTVFWILAGRWAYNIISLVSFSIIISNVSAESYGIYAVASTALIFTELFFTDATENAVIRQRGAESAVVGGAYIICSLSTVLIAITWAALAYPVGGLFGDQDLPLLMLAVSGVVLVQGWGAVTRALLLRRSKGMQYSIYLAVANLGGAAVGIWAAFSGWEAWSLLAQQLTIFSIVFLMGLAGAKREKPSFDYATIREMGWFSATTFGSTFLNVLGNRLDLIVLSLIVSPSVLGYFSMAKRLLQILQDLVASSFDKALITLRSKVNTDESGLAHGTRFYGQSVIAQAIMLLPAFVGFAILSDQLIPAIFGAQWTAVGPLVPLMFLGGIFRSLVTLERAEQVISGDAKGIFNVRLAELLVSVCVLSIFWPFGVEGIAIAFSLRSIIGYFMVVAVRAGSAGSALKNAGHTLRLLAAPLLSTLVMAAAVLLFRGVDIVLGSISIAVETAAGIIVYVLFLILTRRYWLKQLVGGS